MIQHQILVYYKFEMMAYNLRILSNPETKGS